MRINREYKDRLFKFIFQEKENLLQLYNALNKTTYDNPEDLEVVTLGDIIYMRMKNDISFILDYQMNLFEHQSTDNPNMPLRGLLYFARQYEKYVGKNEYNLYTSKLLSIPTPQYVVFYNGNSWTGERKILKLSDSFANQKIRGCMELEVLQLNINYGHNKEMMENCKLLGEYAAFISKVKAYSKSMVIEEAVDLAVKDCIKQGILKEMLISHQAEVKDMILTEYDEEKTMRLFQKEYEEEAAEKIAKVKEEAAREIAKAREVAQEEAAREIAKVKEEAAREIDKLKQELQQANGGIQTD